MDIQDIIDKITECAEANGWHVHTERYRDTALWLFEFSQYTKAGQDFNFSAEMRYADPDTLIKSVREYYENYDPHNVHKFTLDVTYVQKGVQLVTKV